MDTNPPIYGPKDESHISIAAEQSIAKKRGDHEEAVVKQKLMTVIESCKQLKSEGRNADILNICLNQLFKLNASRTSSKVLYQNGLKGEKEVVITNSELRILFTSDAFYIQWVKSQAEQIEQIVEQEIEEERLRKNRTSEKQEDHQDLEGARENVAEKVWERIQVDVKEWLVKLSFLQD